MNEQPRKVKVLTRLKITEVSAVDRGAGENCKVILAKRDDDYNPAELSVEERARAKAEGRTALRHQEEIERRAKRDRDDEDRQRYYDLVTGRKTVEEVYGVNKSDEEPDDNPVDGEHHASKVADLLVESGSHNTRGDALAYLLHHPRGIATLQRLYKSKSEESPAMDSKAKLADLAQRAGVVAIAKAIVDENHAYGISEPELTDLVIAEAKKNYPDLTDAQAFAKMYSEQSEAGVVLRRAFAVAKNAAYANAVESAEKDSAAACAELAAIGKQRWPSLTKAQQFARAFETNPAIAKRAHNRPSIFSTSFPHPVAKAVPLTNVHGVTLTPQSVTETNVDSPEAALAQLREIGRQRWPSASESQAFINAVTDPLNADLVRAALGPPKGSSPARQ